VLLHFCNETLRFFAASYCDSKLAYEQAGERESTNRFKIDQARCPPREVVSNPRAGNVLNRALKSIALPKRSYAAPANDAAPKAGREKARAKRPRNGLGWPVPVRAPTQLEPREQ